MSWRIDQKYLIYPVFIHNLIRVVAFSCVNMFSLQTQHLQVHLTAAPTMWECVNSSVCLDQVAFSHAHVQQVLNLSLTTGLVLPTSPMSSSPLCLPLKALV